MCCFSQPVDEVANTRIFVRKRAGGPEQAVVYAMKLSAQDDLAMVLPVPVPAGSAEDAVEFVSLEGYADLFEDLEAGFPQPKSRGLETLGLDNAPDQQLAVHQVGAYEASFVPSRGDFGRLDPRFRVPEAAWDALPHVADWGFVVFKLRKGTNQEVHPMAFWFPARNPRRLFFPTVHVHDGTAPPRARFDHTLYCQLASGGGFSGDELGRWQESPQPAEGFVKVGEAQELVTGDEHVYRLRLRGTLPNEDTFVALA